jgi:hypothetical protein
MPCPDTVEGSRSLEQPAPPLFRSALNSSQRQLGRVLSFILLVLLICSVFHVPYDLYRGDLASSPVVKMIGSSGLYHFALCFVLPLAAQAADRQLPIVKLPYVSQDRGHPDVPYS